MGSDTMDLIHHSFTQEVFMMRQGRTGWEEHEEFSGVMRGF